MIPKYRILQRRILDELDEIDRTVATIQRHWQGAASGAADTDAYVNSVALNLHSFYSGLERIFELVATQLDEGRLAGTDWHAELLRQMAIDLEEARPAVLSKATMSELDEYRKFRHRIRSIYATHLDPSRMEDLVIDLPEVWRQARQEIETFTDFLDQLTHADQA
jgi:uncharacterized protein YukE